MKAGRELDALVAEKVMGLVIVNESGGQSFGSRGNTIVLPYYSTDIADAWEVVEKIGKEQPNFVLVWWVSAGADNWNAGFACKYEESWTYAAEANTGPLAICLAALKVKGIGIDL